MKSLLNRGINWVLTTDIGYNLVILPLSQLASRLEGWKTPAGAIGLALLTALDQADKQFNFEWWNSDLTVAAAAAISTIFLVGLIQRAGKLDPVNPDFMPPPK